MKHGGPQESDFVAAEQHLKNLHYLQKQAQLSFTPKFMDYLAMQCNKCGDFKGSVAPWSMILSGSIKYLPRLKPMFHR
jgi:hypothetical protein